MAMNPYYTAYAKRRYGSSVSGGCSCPSGSGARIGGALDTIGQEGRKLWKSFWGSGDYSLKTNSLVPGGGSTSGDVTIVAAGPRETRIVYREYIGDVFTNPLVAGDFYAKTYAINPGLVSLFPWLAPIAQQYEQWTPNGIVFEFKSTSSEYVSTQALGSVIMATEYDSLDSVFANKQEMLNSAYANEAKPSQHIIHGVECDPRDNPNRIFYVRAGSVPTGGNIRDYDLGKFTVATQGGATANLNLGSLYVHYDITFRKEQLFNGIPLRGQLNGWYTLTPTINASNPLGSSSPTQTGGNLTLSDVGFSLNGVTFPSWTRGARWMTIYRVGSSTGTAVVVPTRTGTGVTLVNAITSPADSVAGNYGWTIVEVWDQTAATAYVTYGLSGTFPAGTVTGEYRIFQISDKSTTLN